MLTRYWNIRWGVKCFCGTEMLLIFFLDVIRVLINVVNITIITAFQRSEKRLINRPIFTASIKLQICCTKHQISDPSISFVIHVVYQVQIWSLQ